MSKFMYHKGMAQFLEIAKKVIETSKILELSHYPEIISFDSKILTSIKSIHSFTNPTRLFKKDGLSGWEYAFSVFLLIDEIYVSPIISGTYQQVQVAHKVSFKTIPLQNEKAIIQIELDKRTFKSKPYSYELLRTKVNQGFVASFHSHPTELFDSKSYSSFFSAQDLQSLLYGSIPILGLVTRTDIWFLGRSKVSQNIPVQILHEASLVLNKDGTSELKRFLKQSTKDYGITMYHGRIGGSSVVRFL